MARLIRLTTLAACLLLAIGGIRLVTGGAETNVSPVSQAAADPAPSKQTFEKVGHPTFASPHASPLAITASTVFVVNTPADTVDVIDAAQRQVVARVPVGIDPVSVAVRPDGQEVWVSNHVSDSVSVIDANPSSPTYLNVIDTVQDIDPRTQATRFDEPVGIAFASNQKAYVALSSENKIAVVDVPSRKVTNTLNITAQDPRAILVRDGRLFVVPFESNNQTQLSGGTGEIDGELVTFNAHEHSIANNNVLSLGHVVDIVKHPEVPDRDLYVFDTQTDQLIETVDTLGTLLYGLTVDSTGRVFIAQTDARNDVNGRSGTKKHGLEELENRAFLNRITSVKRQDDSDGSRADSEGSIDSEPAGVEFFDLEPLPPQHPAPGKALATPFAIEVTPDDSTLIATAAGSDRLFTVDTSSGQVVGRVAVGSVPRGIALESAAGDDSLYAWVLNAVANSVSIVDVTDPAQPTVAATIELEDPTHPVVKRGRIAFNTAAASTTGTFSCASCHPDGHTDQLLWVLKTPIVTGGNQIMPRSTMPIRGLRDTAPFHWDGIPGDPYGGNNSANVHGSDPPNSSLDNPASSTRHLIDGGLASTMKLQSDTAVNDEGKPGELTAAERDDMAQFLLSVPYPPAQRRAYTNVVSETAGRGFQLFHIDGDLDGKPRPNVCGNCHRMPFWVSTNTPGTGMDAPTWRGAYDRFLILPQGRLNIIDFDFYRRVAERGIPERSVWQFSWGGRRRFDPVWDMVLEGSTGFSGSFARQVTLNERSAGKESTDDLLAALELSASEGAVVLEAEGVLMLGSDARQLRLQYFGNSGTGVYVDRGSEDTYRREDLEKLAARGEFVGTLTARLGENTDADHPQPAIWTLGPIERQRGQQEFPILYEGHTSMTISGRHVSEMAHVVVDGRRVGGRVTVDGETLVVKLEGLPTAGLHLLQLQNPHGLFSNDFIFHVTANAQQAAELRQRIDNEHGRGGDGLARAIAAGQLKRTARLLDRGAPLNARLPDSGSTPLSTAALHGHLEIARLLIERGAKVQTTNRDGNTPLHVAAFFCRTEIVRLLLKHGASPSLKNRRGETAIDVVAGEWSDELAGFYRVIGAAVELQIDLERMQRERPRIKQLLQDDKARTESR